MCILRMILLVLLLGLVECVSSLPRVQPSRDEIIRMLFHVYMNEKERQLQVILMDTIHYFTETKVTRTSIELALFSMFVRHDVIF